ncbi:hypothetical protein HDU80_010137 [Chytriomyces hyalinus]|nr:hypothetical protein HDU80_010137 [Chytriomyces hyalinus]
MVWTRSREKQAQKQLQAYTFIMRQHSFRLVPADTPVFTSFEFKPVSSLCVHETFDEGIVRVWADKATKDGQQKGHEWEQLVKEVEKELAKLEPPSTGEDQGGPSAVASRVILPTLTWQWLSIACLLVLSSCAYILAAVDEEGAPGLD